jgi:ABC-type nitrate/sulfonate/bicarbonate transport system substrate-binding protein
MRQRADRIRPNRRGFLLGACSSVASAWLTRLAAAEAGAQPVRISYPTSGSAGTIWRPLIIRHGTNGLNLNWVGANPGQGQIQLAAGTLDVAFYGAIGLAQTVSHGGDFVLFGPALNNHGRWIVRGDSSFRSPRDLVGKRIATQSESSETFLQARMASLTHGLDLKRDFQIVFGPSTANVALFERGDVDAVIALEPTATRLVGRGARQIASVGDIWREGTGDDTPLFLVGFAAKREWIAANRGTVTGIVDLFRDIYEDVRRRPAVLAELHAEMGIPGGEAEAITLLPRRLAEIYSAEWGPSVFANIDRQIDFAVKTGILKGPPARALYQAV